MIDWGSREEPTGVPKSFKTQNSVTIELSGILIAKSDFSRVVDQIRKYIKKVGILGSHPAGPFMFVKGPLSPSSLSELSACDEGLPLLREQD